MTDLPRLKKKADRKHINIYIDKRIHDLYELAKANQWNPSEIARQAVTAIFEQIAEDIKRPAS